MNTVDNTKEDRGLTLPQLTISPNISPRRGRIAVAKYIPGSSTPKVAGFTTVLIHTSLNTLGGSLSPYQLRDTNGYLLENVWQFSKVYDFVDQQRIPRHRFRPNDIIWEHPAERHVKDEVILPEYWGWRKKGMKAEYAVRYPNGFNGRHKCRFALWDTDLGADPAIESGNLERLSYLDARRKIYCGLYSKLAPLNSEFKKLLAMLDAGKNLLISEVDGPQIDTVHTVTKLHPYLDIDDENTIRLLLNDERRPFGHGYVIAALLFCRGNNTWLQ